ncbi:MAG: TlpA disulfide reductase family protein [Halieaceae bacterium]|nr:TlpA disulfide reductase family protein [Halieaceae bacterium]
MESPERPSEKSGSWTVTLVWMAPVLALVLILAYGWWTRPAPKPDLGPRVGEPLADFTFPDMDGRPVQLAALRGKVVFINVWTTWCPPCIEEMPTIQRLHEKLNPKGLVVLAINMDALGRQTVEPFLSKRRLTFPILLDPESQTERLYRTAGIPESFIVDKAGLLVEKVIGPRDWAHPEVIALFERLLASPHS